MNEQESSKKIKYDNDDDWRDRMVERAKREAQECPFDIKFAVNRNAQYGNWLVIQRRMGPDRSMSGTTSKRHRLDSKDQSRVIQMKTWDR